MPAETAAWEAAGLLERIDHCALCLSSRRGPIGTAGVVARLTDQGVHPRLCGGEAGAQLRARNGRFVGVRRFRVRAAAEVAGRQERFALLDPNGGCVDSGDVVFLRTADGYYLRSYDDTTRVDGRGLSTGPWARFVVGVRRDGGIRRRDTITLRTRTAATWRRAAAVAPSGPAAPESIRTPDSRSPSSSSQGIHRARGRRLRRSTVHGQAQRPAGRLRWGRIHRQREDDGAAPAAKGRRQGASVVATGSTVIGPRRLAAISSTRPAGSCRLPPRRGDAGPRGRMTACTFASPPRSGTWSSGHGKRSPSALHALFARYRSWLRPWARGRLPPEGAALDTSDLVQDSLHRTFARLKWFEPNHDGALQAYLRRAVDNRVRDELRRAVCRRDYTVSEERLRTIDEGAPQQSAAVGRCRGRPDPGGRPLLRRSDRPARRHAAPRDVGRDGAARD